MARTVYHIEENAKLLENLKPPEETTVELALNDGSTVTKLVQPSPEDFAAYRAQYEALFSRRYYVPSEYVFTHAVTQDDAILDIESEDVLAKELKSKNTPFGLLGVKQARKKELTKFYNELLGRGAYYDGALFEIDDAARINISGAVTMALASTALMEVDPNYSWAVIQWKDAGNSDYALTTPIETIAWGALLGQSYEKMFYALQVKKSEIDGLADVKDVLSYPLTTGWPNIQAAR